MDATPEVEQLVDAVEGTVAVYARRLDDREVISVGPVDELFPTGSAAKLLVLLAFAELVAAGNVNPEAQVRVDFAYAERRLGSGVLRYLSPGLALTLHDCATLMMILSDNVATDLLLDVLGGPDVVNATCRAAGVADAEVTSPTVWVLPPGQFGMASPRGLADAWTQLRRSGPVAERCRDVTWRHQLRDGFGRLVPFQPDLPDFGFRSRLGLWSKGGSYPSVSCEAGLFETESAAWVLAVMGRNLADRGNSSSSAGPTLRAEVSRVLFDAWGR